MTMPGLLAHQGGWDEVLVLMAPLALFVVLRILTAWRVRRRQGDD
jgi:hypothetical protein